MYYLISLSNRAPRAYLDSDTTFFRTCAPFKHLSPFLDKLGYAGLENIDLDNPQYLQVCTYIRSELISDDTFKFEMAEVHLISTIRPVAGKEKEVSNDEYEINQY